MEGQSQRRYGWKQGNDLGMGLQAEACGRLWKLGKARIGFSPGASGRSAALLDTLVLAQ